MGWNILEENGYILQNIKMGKQVQTFAWSKILNYMGYFHQYHITPNIELQKLMIDRYTEFWQKNIIEQIMPEP